MVKEQTITWDVGGTIPAREIRIEHIENGAVVMTVEDSAAIAIVEMPRGIVNELRRALHG